MTEFNRTCYICLINEEEETTEEIWVHPCRCRGTTKWCHQACILRWLEEKQRDSTDSDTFPCPVCHAAIVIIYPRMSLPEKLCELADRITTRLAPLGAAALGLGAVYWTALGFGAATYVQVWGMEAAIKHWNSNDQLVTLIALPVIPLALILTRLINWEDSLLARFRQNYQHLPKPLRHLLPIDESTLRSGNMSNQVCTRRSYSRMFCSAFIFPSGSVLCGRIFLPQLRTSRVRQALFGSLVYVALKGMLTIYTKHSQWLQRARRAVQNYMDPDDMQIRRSVNRQRHSHRRSQVNFPVHTPPLDVIDDNHESVHHQSTELQPEDSVVQDAEALVS